MPHGLANAVILPYFLEEYGPACYGKLAKLARCIGMVPKHTNDRRVAAAFIQWIKDMKQYMKIPETIQEIRKEDIPAMAEKSCYGDGRGGSLGGFVKLGKEDVEKIFRLAL